MQSKYRCEFVFISFYVRTTSFFFGLSLYLGCGIDVETSMMEVKSWAFEHHDVVYYVAYM